jgi:methylglyoxal synthase
MQAIGMIAHDRLKQALCAWVSRNVAHFQARAIVATGTTARLLKAENPELMITGLKSGPLGGDQQMGAMIADSEISALFFFQDPMTAQPHDVDVKALIRLATVYDIPVACNESTANYLISSPYFAQPTLAPAKQSIEQRYTDYLSRAIQTQLNQS